MRKIFTIFLLVSMMCVSICGCSSASARQETLLTIEEKTEVDALETAITATDANQTIEEPEGVVRHTEGVDGFSDDIDYLSIMKQSCLNGDYEAGVVAEKARNKKIDVIFHPEHSWLEHIAVSLFIDNTDSEPVVHTLITTMFEIVKVIKRESCLFGKESIDIPRCN